ncbi:hypothetical protein Tco_1409388 [Tanacetum coccineum]
MSDAPFQDRPTPISRRYTHITGVVKRMCRHQGFMMQHMQNKFVTNNHFQGILEKVNESLKEIIPKIATSATNNLIKDNLSRLVSDAVKKERESSQPMKSDLQSQLADLELWNALKNKYEKFPASNESCSIDAFCKRNHDEHHGDDAPLGGRRVRKGKRHRKAQSLQEALHLNNKSRKPTHWHLNNNNKKIKMHGLIL